MPSGGHNKKSQTEHWLRDAKPTAAPVEYQVPAAVPKPPKGLAGDAKKLFKQLAKQLAQRRAATAADVHLLHLYVVVHQRAARAQAQVDTLGEVVTDTKLDNHGTAHEVLRKNPWLAVLEVCETKMHSILRELGLTPNARTRVKPTAPAVQPGQFEEGSVGWMLAQQRQQPQPVAPEPEAELVDVDALLKIPIN
jgi:P27 family predicted phage terminase small subunit